MPRKQITFIVIPPNDGQVQEYKFSPKLLWVGGLVSAALFCALGYYSLHFHTRVDQTREIVELTDQNRRLVRSLDTARGKIQGLEGFMASLAEQDQRLRDYHEMEPLRDESMLLGVGGRDQPDDLPEDYTQLPDSKRALLEDLSWRVDRLQREARYQQSSFEALLRTFENNEANLKYVPTIWPVDRNKVWPSSGFGERTDPFTGRPATHLGLDLAGRKGLQVIATADGEIAFAYEDKHLGKVIVINHNPIEIGDDGTVTSRRGILRTEYGHLSKILVRKGQRVERGDVVGLMGNTGRSTGPHLHYAVRYQVRSRGGLQGYNDPKDYLLDWSIDDRPDVYMGSRRQ